jgi:hypothetical protein
LPFRPPFTDFDFSNKIFFRAIGFKKLFSRKAAKTAKGEGETKFFIFSWRLCVLREDSPLIQFQLFIILPKMGGMTQLEPFDTLR